jgi:hypothetical protein
VSEQQPQLYDNKNDKASATVTDAAADAKNDLNMP